MKPNEVKGAPLDGMTPGERVRYVLEQSRSSVHRAKVAHHVLCRELAILAPEAWAAMELLEGERQAGLRGEPYDEASDKRLREARRADG